MSDLYRHDGKPMVQCGYTLEEHGFAPVEPPDDEGEWRLAWVKFSDDGPFVEDVREVTE